jgi:RND family efflux transporter MFP subunit
VVQVLVAKPETYQSIVHSQGTVVPTRQINLAAEVSGRVNKVSDNFVEGGAFQANQSLIALDDRDYRFALVNAESSVAAAERELALQKGQARQAKREWRDLGSKEANALSLRQPQVRAAEAAVAAAKAERDRAQLNLQRTEISTPFSGRVQEKMVDLGQFVTVGSVLGVVYDSSAVKVRLPLNQEQLVLSGLVPGLPIHQQKPLDVSLFANVGGERYQWTATLSRMDASIDSATRFYHVIAEVVEPFNLSLHAYPLVVGLFVEAEIQGKVFNDALKLPKKALIDDKIFIVNDEDKLVIRELSIIDQKDDIVWVQSSAINAGDKIVISDPRVLREELIVRVRGEAASSREQQEADQ